jgi:hypothetical protein
MDNRLEETMQEIKRFKAEETLVMANLDNAKNKLMTQIADLEYRISEFNTWKIDNGIDPLVCIHRINYKETGYSIKKQRFTGVDKNIIQIVFSINDYCPKYLIWVVFDTNGESYLDNIIEYGGSKFIKIEDLNEHYQETMRLLAANVVSLMNIAVTVKEQTVLARIKKEIDT